MSWARYVRRVGPPWFQAQIVRAALADIRAERRRLRAFLNPAKRRQR